MWKLHLGTSCAQGRIFFILWNDEIRTWRLWAIWGDWCTIMLMDHLFLVLMALFKRVCLSESPSFIYIYMIDEREGITGIAMFRTRVKNIFEKNYEIHFIPENWIFWKQLALYNNWRMCCRFHCLDSVKTLARRLSSELCFFFYIICKEKEHAPSSPS